ncbi:uncharacterized protein PAE49_002331 isoform 2-T2 [Odontesthes bonariensis]|uniref:uncharacterized protein LOC142374954 isoform X2 n=1 Tax=Odontesthes bonariensis TaxID=219752 RepID=UPI003F585E52
MVKCAVSGCPNRMVSYNRGVFSRPPRRFFSFPRDPDRVKVWLAALRETEMDASEQHVICEDHFLPEDISRKGLVSDAIPLMPPFLDRPLGLISPGGPGTPEEEEEEQWVAEESSDEEEEEEDPTQQDPEAPESPSDLQNICVGLQRNEASREDITTGTPLSLLTRGLLELLLAAPGGAVDLRRAATSLQTRAQRVHGIVDVLEGIGLVQREAGGSISWIGSSPICSFLWRNPLKFLTALEKLKLVEHKLDRLIRSCSQQLFHLTDDVHNSAAAYVTCEDVVRLTSFQDQTVVVIKAPQETKLHIPEPEENRIQVHLTAGKGPITALTCEVGAGGVATSDPKENGAVFSELQDGRVGMRTLIPDFVDCAEDSGGGAKSSSEQTRRAQEPPPPREMGPRCQSPACHRSSKHHCRSIGEAERETIFKSFWENMNLEQKKRYVRSLVDITPVQRRRGSGFSKRESSLVFFLNFGGQRRRVCRGLFLATLGIKEWSALRWIRDR